MGVGGTIVLDLWALLLTRVFNVPATNWAMVGRWLGNMPRGVFAHRSMAEAPPVTGETAIGWAFHYAIGIGYGLLLLAVCGREWFERPTLLPPMILVWAALVLPYFVMMPGMGSGVAGARTARPNVARLKSLATHSVFGLGLYVSASVFA
ncbi:MAG TPA: DUF2938 domain-containing protein [Croceibacterium sp.]|nr:DUF2938 domain-containing protein [Croceibacterium sp.]